VELFGIARKICVRWAGKSLKHSLPSNQVTSESKIALKTHQLHHTSAASSAGTKLSGCMVESWGWVWYLKRCDPNYHKRHQDSDLENDPKCSPYYVFRIIALTETWECYEESSPWAAIRG
jgi:hypothetical protein